MESSVRSTYHDFDKNLISNAGHLRDKKLDKKKKEKENVAEIRCELQRTETLNCVVMEKAKKKVNFPQNFQWEMSLAFFYVQLSRKRSALFLRFKTPEGLVG
jgi:hypothetical protein